MQVRRLILVVLLVLTSGNYLLASAPLNAAGTAHIVVSELAPGYSGHSGDEFIELYNPTDETINLAGWTLQYKAAGSTCTGTWTTKAKLAAGSLAPHGFYLVGAGNYSSVADFKIASSLGLGDTAGSVRLVSADTAVIDTVGWGGGNACAEGTAVAALPRTRQSAISPTSALPRPS
jgi:predicted extracellular nuclease